MKILSRYRKALEKKFSRKPILRKEFNFPCDVALSNKVRLLAKYLKCPIYILMEEVTERGLSDIGEIIKDQTLTKQLQRHLLKDHLLVDHINPESQTDSQHAKRLRATMQLLKIVEVRGLQVEDIKELISLFEAELDKRKYKI